MCSVFCITPVFEPLHLITASCSVTDIVFAFSGKTQASFFSTFAPGEVYYSLHSSVDQLYCCEMLHLLALFMPKMNSCTEFSLPYSL